MVDVVITSIGADRHTTGWSRHVTVAVELAAAFSHGGDVVITADSDDLDELETRLRIRARPGAAPTAIPGVHLGGNDTDTGSFDWHLRLVAGDGASATTEQRRVAIGAVVVVCSPARGVALDVAVDGAADLAQDADACGLVLCSTGSGDSAERGWVWGHIDTDRAGDRTRTHYGELGGEAVAAAIRAELERQGTT